MFSKREKGFTLIELLLAVLILSWAVGGMLLLYTFSMRSSELAWNTIVATSHAEHILEEMQVLDTLEDILAVDWQNWSGKEGLNTLPDETIDVSFAQPNSNPLSVAVAVRWIRESREHQVALKTKITK